ncbi:hypothetical protein [Candidatus Poriferisodalis sp.]|uniref:hypothetical protein n=1 Tax=Candidatus Poriferisodalis sp. TaxID=3101277 RepID=UPI003B012946
MSEVRTYAIALLRRHVIRAADAGQLGAVLHLQHRLGVRIPFVCLDQRLAEAAASEGFAVIAA